MATSSLQHRSKRVRVQDLKDQIGLIGPRPVLYCSACGQTYSANAGDYWAAKPGHIFKCHGRNMALVIKRVTYHEVA